VVQAEQVQQRGTCWRRIKYFWRALLVVSKPRAAFRVPVLYVPEWMLGVIKKLDESLSSEGEKRDVEAATI
jgi:hypothetical protein